MRRFASAAAALAVLVAACSPAVTPTGSDSVDKSTATTTVAVDTTGATTPIMQERSGEPATIWVTRNDDASVTETIDSSGGRISIDRGDLTITLRIPEGAVTDPVDITLTPVVDAESAVIDGRC